MALSKTTENTVGVLSNVDIKNLVDSGNILNVEAKNIGPASLDLSVSSEIYLVKYPVVPHNYKDTLSFFKDNFLIDKKWDINVPLSKNKTYLVKFRERFGLPEDIRGVFSPKSTMGRLDMHVRALNPYYGRLDILHKGFKGEVWALVTPHAFSIKLYEGATITQVRLIKGDPRLHTYKQTLDFIQKYSPIKDKNGKVVESKVLFDIDLDNFINLTLALDSELVGWVTKNTERFIDLSVSKGYYNPYDFFDPILQDDLKNKTLLLKKDRLYILSTAEYILVPNGWSLEFLPVDIYSGEFRSHYAGFVDPGWGLKNKIGRPITLEVRPFEDLVVSDKQPIAKAAWDRLLSPASIHYDNREGSNYVAQNTVKLAKYFK